MKGSTQWLLRPGDVVSMDKIMARRWEKAGLAVIVSKGEAAKPKKTKPAKPDNAESEATVAQLREIAKANNLPVWGTKAELTERLKEAQIPTEVNLLEPELS